jgi:hypothetical protein
VTFNHISAPRALIEHSIEARLAGLLDFTRRQQAEQQADMAAVQLQSEPSLTELEMGQLSNLMTVIADDAVVRGRAAA